MTIEKNSINHKTINQLIASRKRIKLKNTAILTSDVNHILAKDITELYLKLNFCSNISWIDINNQEIKTSTLFTNILNISKSLLAIPFVKSNLNSILDRENKCSEKNSLPFHSDLKIIYLRTDHWFNLRSGGSVGHTSGVVNSMINKGVLTSLVSSSKLFNVNWLPHFKIISPNYSKTGNIPNLSELNYNQELISNNKKITDISFNTIYQRYSLGNIFGVFLRRVYKVPLILEFNGSEVWVSKNWSNSKVYFLNLLSKIELLNLNFADKIIVVSQVLKNTLIEKGITPEKILVNPNGVDCSIYKPNCGGDKIRQKLGVSTEFIIGFIGTFGKWHGAIVMAKAIRLYFENYPDSTTKFLLIGEGNDLAEVKDIIKKAGVEKSVIYTGRIDQSEGPSYLDACNVLLSPHIPNPDGTDFFGSPTKLFEYMAMGKTIIASNLNQIGEILEHNKTAILIEPNNETILAETIEKAIENPELYKKLGENARNEVLAKYTWDKHVEKIIAFLYA